MYVTNIYNFPANSQGWSPTDEGCHGSYDAVFDDITGNPSGSLNFIQSSGSFGLNANGVNPDNSYPICGHWSIGGVWTNFGVPSGSIVNSIQLINVDERAINNTALLGFGPYELRGGDGSLLATLLSVRNPSGNESSWVSRSGTLQTVPSGFNSSSSSMFVWAKSSTATSGYGQGNIDNIQFNITYSTPVYNASGSLSTKPFNLGGSGHYYLLGNTGSVNLTRPKFTILGSDTYFLPYRAYSASGILSTKSFNTNISGSVGANASAQANLTPKHPALNASGTFWMASYHGSGNFATNPFTLSSNPIFVPKTYTGSANLSTNKFFLTDNAKYIAYRYTGPANLPVNPFSMIGIGTATTYSLLQYNANANLSTKHFGMAGAATNNPKTYIGTAFLRTSSLVVTSTNRPVLKTGLNLFINAGSQSQISVSQSAPLFVYGDIVSTIRVGGAATPASSAMNLYVAGVGVAGNLKTPLNLFIGGGGSKISQSIPMLVYNNHQFVLRNFPLTIIGDGIAAGFVPVKSMMDLYISGQGSGVISFQETLTSASTFFISGGISTPQKLANSITLFLQVDDNTSVTSSIPLYIGGMNLGSVSGTIPMIIKNVHMSQNAPLYIHGF